MGKVTKISDDDEKGTAKRNAEEGAPGIAGGTAEEKAMNLVETTGADKRFVTDPALMRIVSAMPEDRKDDKRHKAADSAIGEGKGLPEGEEVIDAAVHGRGDDKFLVVVTNKYRKYVRVL